MARPHRQRGFTLIEMVTVMIIVGILAVVAIPYFMDRTFDERGFHDTVRAALQHARHVAVASRRYICVNVVTGTGPAATVSIVRDLATPETPGAVNCTSDVALPAPGRGCAASNQVCAPEGVTLGGGGLIFDPLGRAVDSAKAVLGTAPALTVTNQPNITVTPQTGYVQ